MATESFDNQWYVLHTYAGYENRVKSNLESRIETMGMKDYIFRVLVPEQEVEVEKDGETKIIKENDFPGYALVEMIMTDEAWYVVRNTPGVTGFLGSHGGGSKPVPLLPEEVDDMLARMNIVERKVEHLDIAVGDLVDVVAGSFAGQEGAAVTDVDEEHQEVTVLINIFGRDTPTQISFSDIKPVK
ncbi:transcription termination/antitermination protein NusG [Weissella sagaensis]|jgi:transcriptional antiterminator NusG|uniref:Transcription termination/antitermination protein NusG n=1 Tax=Weissella sagaensis TaxID=2559928 RepID=A0ABW1RUD8_9LACO|nr:transcription termination/antitermination protein NusG [Weissella sagaensis]KAA8434718.1 transcription termination/antitermination protein NusG [Weissella paramesenteroides]QDJ59388.1 transcription termination/antitermination protein NusG [Weissella hellenica]KAA8437678.1 transcription termination/antitermination protein NusG [Weissella paramesenteroides]QEA56700.1 transcription termination/antitermination protein NusG [Weissella hellenica]UEG67511.1 transcription termination/antiterminatio